MKTYKIEKIKSKRKDIFIAVIDELERLQAVMTSSKDGCIYNLTIIEQTNPRLLDLITIKRIIEKDIKDNNRLTTKVVYID